jgi:sucrose synthase
LRRLEAEKRPFMLSTDLSEIFQGFSRKADGRPLKHTAVETVFTLGQESAMRHPWIYVSVRHAIAEWKYLRFHTEEVLCDEVSVTEFLEFKEQLMEPNQSEDQWVLEVDLQPFERGFPKLKEVRSIGRGVEYLNRHLSSHIFKDLQNGSRSILDFLMSHQLDGRQLMLNELIRNIDQLRSALRKADALLGRTGANTAWSSIEEDMARIGFAPGWGRTAGRVRKMLGLLSDLLQAPDPKQLERFLSRIPMIFRIAILSPHGFFGQSDVLGKPDTGGQVVYILDQVRALEQQMRKDLYDQGVDTQPQIVVVTRLIPNAGNTNCNQRLEHIMGTENARILRIPFRNGKGEIVQQWVRRFNIWPYLERFAGEVERELPSELGGSPDMVIGNYSDGNLVATLLSQRLGITQCNIAHALEKNKYLYSALRWKEYEDAYHFSCQFTADLIAMNSADFIITSTYQEIAGKEDSQGQYESYGSFTMPGLYRVLNGVDVFDPKFNIVSPGADPKIFFPYTEKDRRIKGLRTAVKGLVFESGRSDSRGQLARTEKPIILAMSRLDHVKNVSGLVECFAKSKELQKHANLLIVGGNIDPNLSDDADERAQIEYIHRLMNEHQLDNVMRWVNMQSDKNVVGEVYRLVADHRGVFVQPALFEAFGLTVIEAMSSALPVFATCYGGPLEIIEHGKSGFHVDPNHGDQVAKSLARFFGKCSENPKHWERISRGAMKRVEKKYTWKLYASRLLSLSRIYGFWKHISNIEREETDRYLQMFYGLMYKPLAESVPGIPETPAT